MRGQGAFFQATVRRGEAIEAVGRGSEASGRFDGSCLRLSKRKLPNVWRVPLGVDARKCCRQLAATKARAVLAVGCWLCRSQMRRVARDQGLAGWLAGCLFLCVLSQFARFPPLPPPSRYDVRVEYRIGTSRRWASPPSYSPRVQSLRRSSRGLDSTGIIFTCFGRS